MPRKCVYDYYDVYIPRDAVPDDAECEFENQDIFEIAFVEARMRTRIYAMPCVWTATLIDDPDSANYHVRVRRKRYSVPHLHYHVLIGVPGYMPVTNDVCKSRTEAECCALWYAKNFRKCWDSYNDRAVYHVEGNKRDGYEIYCPNGIRPEDVYMTIHITACSEEECLRKTED